MSHTDLHAKTEQRAYGQKKTAPAQTYPTKIAEPTTPDETQETEEQPEFQTWYKGYLTKSEIYERLFPDGLTSALRIDGPDANGISLTDDGSIKILTGKRNTEKGAAGGGKLCIKTWGQQHEHHERSNLKFNYGSDKEKQALNILCVGDYVEQVQGGTRYINATKVLISASAELVLEGQTIKLQSDGEITMAAPAINSTQTNKKDTVTGEKKTSGAGVDVTEQFDPRANVVWNSPNIQWNVSQDYQQIVGGCLHQSSVGGAGVLIKDRTFGYYAGTTTNAALAGTTAAGIYSSGEMDLVAASNVYVNGADFDITAGKIDAVAADVNLDAAKVDIVGSGDVSITSAGNVRLTGALIFLN